MRPLFKARPKPFLDAPRRDWQFATFGWLLRHTGGYARFPDTPLVLPIAAHFPDRGMTGHAAVLALFRRVRDHAGMADWPCTVEPENPDVEVPATPGQLPVIRYPRDIGEPQRLVAHFARELARYLVDSFDDAPPGGPALREPALELASVFMGFGVFMANTAVSTRWHLNEGELANALALFCLLRQIPTETVEPHLNAHLRKHVRLALADLEQHRAAFQALRAVRDEGLEAAECTLPSVSA